MDIDDGWLAAIKKAIDKIVDAGGYSAKVTATKNRVEALKEADGVVCTILAGGENVWRHDIEIPKKYGVDIKKKYIWRMILMLNFTYHNPTRLIFGKNSLQELGKVTAQYGKRALLITGKGSIKKTGLYDRAVSLLKQEVAELSEFEGVNANPHLGDCEKAAAICREKGIEVIVAIGGGSVNDTAKIVSFLALENGYENIRDFFNGKREVTRALPIITVLTVAATGTEYNGIAVVRDEAEGKKYGIHSEHIYPKVSILNPEFTYSVLPKYTALGALDAITHVLEYYIQAPEHPDFQMACVEALIQTIMKNLDTVQQDPKDYEARANLMLCCSIACCGLYLSGTGGGNFVAHLTSSEIEGIYDVAHGEGLSVIMPAVMRYYVEIGECIPTTARFAEKVMKIERRREMTETDIALKGIEAFRQWLKKVGNPTTLKELGIMKQDLPAIAQRIGLNPGKLDTKAALDILEVYAE